MKNKKIQRASFEQILREEFDFDVSTLQDYVDNTGDEIITAAVLGASLVGRVNVMTGVKGSKNIKLMNMETPLQSADACGRTPSGDILFSDKKIEVKGVKIDEKICNKDLKDTWAQMLLQLGYSRQNETMPFEDIISAFTVMRANLRNQQLMFNGDTASLNPDLVHYDGFVKKFTADATIPAIPFAGAFSQTNAFDRFRQIAQAATPEIGLAPGTQEIICSRADAQAVINNIWNTKDYNALLASQSIDRTNGEISFVLPTTDITVRAYPQLKTGEVFLVPYGYMFFGTDLEGDIDSFYMDYEKKDQAIYFGVEFASGVQYVYPEHFVKAVVTP